MWCASSVFSKVELPDCGPRGVPRWRKGSSWQMCGVEATSGKKSLLNTFATLKRHSKERWGGA
jgi:hypothetical protein